MDKQLDKELIDFALSEGYQNIKMHIKSLAIMRKEANSTIGFLVTGGGASLGYAIKLLEEHGSSQVMVGLFEVSIYLFALCGILLWKCLCADNVMPAHCEPQNVYLPDYELLAIKQAEIKQLQERCDFNRLRTWEIGWWLNIVRGLIFITPVVFIAAWGLARLFVAAVTDFPCAYLVEAALPAGQMVEAFVFAVLT